MTLHDWTGQLITTNIMAEVLKDAGYIIEFGAGRLPGPIRRPEDRDLQVAMEMLQG